MLTPAEIHARILTEGGATVNLHGRRYLMGDEYDPRTYVVGGAVDDEGRTFAAVFGPGTWDADVVSAALDVMTKATERHRYVYTAAGFWVDPAGALHIDLVETLTVKAIALQWAEARGEAAIHELKSGETIWTTKGHEALIAKHRKDAYAKTREALLSEMGGAR